MFNVLHFFYFFNLNLIHNNTIIYAFLYNFYNLLSVHKHIFNHTSFETVLSLYEVGRNLCCKKPEPFGNLPVRKTLFDGSRLGIYLFVKQEPNRLCPRRVTQPSQFVTLKVETRHFHISKICN